MSSIGIRHKQAGSISLFVAAVVLPFMFLLFSLSLDGAKFFTERERTQELIDKASMRAVQALPYQIKAEQIARGEIESVFGPLGASLQINTSSDAVSIVIDRVSHLTFPTYFGISAGLPFKLASTARVSPLDIVVAMDSSVYLAPPIDQSWDNGVPGLWPGSIAFNFITLPPLLNNIDSALFMTQRCLNPALKPLKEATKAFYDYVGSVQMNFIGLAFFPNANGSRGVFDSRNLIPAGFYDVQGNLAAEASIENHPYTMSVDIGSGILADISMGDADCAAIIDHETYPPYTIPPTKVNLNSPSIQYPGTQNVNTMSLANGSFFDLDSGFLPYVGAHQAIWSRHVRDTSWDVDAVMDQLHSMVISAQAATSRGGLIYSSRKAIVIFAGDVPYYQGNRFPDASVKSELDTALNQLDPDPAIDDSYDVSLYYIVFKHPGNQSYFDSAVTQLQAYVASRPRVKILRADDATFLDKLKDQVALVERRSLLSK